jgi:Xaa-Pro aminopeptidase
MWRGGAHLRRDAGSLPAARRRAPASGRVGRRPGRRGRPELPLRDVVREALEAARTATQPGITGGALYDVAAEVVERAGYPTQRTRAPGERLTHGFYFGLGLEAHESPWLALASNETLVAGDVVAIEPGIEGLEEIGGVRFEDLLLITDDGCETLTRYAYDL